MESVLQHLTYKGCHADIKFDPHNMVFVGEIINTADAVSFLTDRADDIETAFHRCVDQYLGFFQAIASATQVLKPFSSSENAQKELSHDTIIREYRDAVAATKALSECPDVSSAVRTEARHQYLIYKAGYEALLNPCLGCIHASPLPPCQNSCQSGSAHSFSST